MTAPAPDHDHGAYIEDVVNALVADGLTVTTWHASTPDGREAYIELGPDHEGDLPALAWDDASGWKWGWVYPDRRDQGIQCLTDLVLLSTPSRLERRYLHAVAHPSVVSAALIASARLDLVLDANVPGDVGRALAAYNTPASSAPAGSQGASR